ncbi:MAG: hypothetical protein RI572_09140 [Salegentibacter sp.]|uniref:Uncharacterized protein n=1 Tax=Salegentibacter flavus TaxID=287099 RepID=A0A1I4ZZ77_9FLAO|nr:MULTISPECIES: hypothetical protein [Salegentibacter]MDR9457562.1 hypothetical protein [Salegentibacter sp.]SFN55512.1 hypothetical protein SAMN05660413_01582 [Salegentibacter flavus]
MDTASSLIGLGLLLVFIGPILILIVQQNKQEKKTLNKLKTISRDNNLNPDTTELLENLILGLDLKARKLLIVNPGKNPEYNILNLKELKEIGLSTQKDKNPEGRLNYISLNLFGVKNKKLDEIVFYNEDDENSLNAEACLVLAKKWENLIRT